MCLCSLRGVTQGKKRSAKQTLQPVYYSECTVITESELHLPNGKSLMTKSIRNVEKVEQTKTDKGVLGLVFLCDRCRKKTKESLTLSITWFIQHSSSQTLIRLNSYRQRSEDWVRSNEHFESNSDRESVCSHWRRKGSTYRPLNHQDDKHLSPFTNLWI